VLRLTELFHLIQERTVKLSVGSHSSGSEIPSEPYETSNQLSQGHESLSSGKETNTDLTAILADTSSEVSSPSPNDDLEVGMFKICEMVGVREYGESKPVELWRDDETGRLVIRASNECGNNSTSVDLFELLDWVASDTGKRHLNTFGQVRTRSD